MKAPYIQTSVERRLTRQRRESSGQNSARICPETSQRSARRGARGCPDRQSSCDRRVGRTASRGPRVSPVSFRKTLIYPLYLMQRTLSREGREDESAWGSRTATARNQPLQSR